jgi:hypothetical protein
VFPDNRYAALILKEVSGDPLHKGLLRSPLTLACLISEYSRLIFPMRGAVSPIIDSVFDEALRYLDLEAYQTLKEFVTNSKGILYAKDLAADERAGVLEHAAFISQCYGRELIVRTWYLEGDFYEQLAGRLPAYVKISSRIGRLAAQTRRNAPDAAPRRKQGD